MKTNTAVRAAIVVWSIAGLLSVPAAGQDPANVDATLSAAKLAETRGDLGGAERVLREALAAAPEPARPRLAAALAALLRRQGREQDAAAVEGRLPAGQSQSEDPVHALIRQLDLGTSGVGGPAAPAVKELRALGVLAVPHLLAALPDLGPFGLRNALLLLDLDDPLVQEPILARLDAGDRPLALAVAARLEERSRPAHVPLARKLLGIRETVRHGLAILARHVPDDPELQRVATALVDSAPPRELSHALHTLADVHRPWARALLDRARAHADPSVRDAASFAWLRSLSDDEEAAAVEAVAALPAAMQASFTWVLDGKRTAWVRFAATILPAVAARQPDAVGNLLRSVEWWRAPDVAGRAILALPHDSRFRNERLDALHRLAGVGWQIPTSADEDLLAFVSGMPPHRSAAALCELLANTPEDRVLALLATMPPDLRAAFAREAAGTSRPWPRVIATLCEHPDLTVASQAIARDWTGAPPEVVAALVEVARRGDRRLARSVRTAWHQSHDLPLDFALPLLATDVAVDVFADLAARNPRAVLDHLRSVPAIPDGIEAGVVELLGRHGSPQDVPLALRLAREHDFLIRHAGSGDELAAFLGRQGRGNLDVVALATVPARALPDMEWRRCMAA
ncbi:MAG TPA: hypothetical protein VK081_00005, partial [Planctomycetota bacterium]|nr:hypothetical protein [Planctomycetota bacterium]